MINLPNQGTRQPAATDPHWTAQTIAAALRTPQPWLLHHAPVAQRILRAAHPPSIAAALNAARDAADAFCFVEQSELPAGESYELFIARTARIPTRDNAHDLFNGLIWLGYPETKQRLNALHAGQIALHGTTGQRGSLRDALTLFDENAVILQAPPALTDALRRRDWNTAFVTQRALWESTRIVVFGHALLEKLMLPRKAITAHAWLVDKITDGSLASSLQPERLTTKDFLPLPVLGVPGWWSANNEPGFYNDAEVFRPSRQV